MKDNCERFDGFPQFSSLLLRGLSHRVPRTMFRSIAPWVCDPGSPLRRPNPAFFYPCLPSFSQVKTLSQMPKPAKILSSSAEPCSLRQIKKVLPLILFVILELFLYVTCGFPPLPFHPALLQLSCPYLHGSVLFFFLVLRLVACGLTKGGKHYTHVHTHTQTLRGSSKSPDYFPMYFSFCLNGRSPS